MTFIICQDLRSLFLCSRIEPNMKKTFILSDGSKRNSKGYKVDVYGINLERFKANPVMLSEHNPEKVIGRWENIRIENNKLMADAVFDLDDPLGKEIAGKVERGFLRAASIGIIPMNLEYINEEFIMVESEQVEGSIVSIPSDAGAIRLYNEQMEELSFDQVKINFNLTGNNTNPNKQIMAEPIFKLSARTVESLSLSPDYTPREVELAVAEKDREIETLSAKLKAIEKSSETDYLNLAVKAGKITEAEKLSFEKMAEKGCFADVKSLIESRPEKASASLAEQVTQTNLSAGRETWDYMKWMKDDPKGLNKIRTENPKEFERLQLTIKK